MREVIISAMNFISWEVTPLPNMAGCSWIMAAMAHVHLIAFGFVEDLALNAPSLLKICHIIYSPTGMETHVHVYDSMHI